MTPPCAAYPKQSISGRFVWADKKQTVTEKITVCRKKLKLNAGVEERSIKIQDTMDMVYTNEEQHRQTEQERKRGAKVR